MVIEPSRWQWHKFKDMFHYYFMVGAIPVTAVIFYSNVFIGPATLAEIPEGYEPKHWEYYKVQTLIDYSYFKLSEYLLYISEGTVHNLITANC